jgi:hypothetical protein
MGKRKNTEMANGADSRGDRRSILQSYALLVFSIIFFLGVTIPRIHQPAARDEMCWIVGSKTFYEGGTPIYFIDGSPFNLHPILYPKLISIAFHFFGVRDTVTRGTGLFLGVLSILLVFIAVRSFAAGTIVDRSRFAALGSFLLASAIVTVQGFSLVIEDTTVLVPTSIFLHWCYVKFLKEEKARWAVLAGLAITIAMWGKLTSPPFFVLLFIVFVLVFPISLRSKGLFIGIFSLGIGLFLATWYWYCQVNDILFSRPFTYAFGRLLGGVEGSTRHVSFMKTAVESGVAESLWLGGIFVLLFLWMLIARGRLFFRNFKLLPEDIFLLSGVGLYCGFNLINGASYGFPRLMAPAFPLLCIFIVLQLSRSQFRWGSVRFPQLIMVVAGAAIIQVYLGDLVYVYRYSLREAAALSLPLSPIFKNILLRLIPSLAAFLVLFALCYKYLLKKQAAVILILFAIGANTALSVMYAAAKYSTGFNHGARGTYEAVRYIRNSVPRTASIIAPGEIIYYLNMPNAIHGYSPMFKEKTILIPELLKPNTYGLTYNICFNTINEVKLMQTDPDIQAELKKDYRFKKIGNNYIWIRKK